MTMNPLAFVLGNFINSADVGMVQRRRRAGLTTEALQHLRILRNILRQELEGDEAAEHCVFGFVHHAHPAAAKFLDYAVMRNGLT